MGFTKLKGNGRRGWELQCSAEHRASLSSMLSLLSTSSSPSCTMQGPSSCCGLSRPFHTTQGAGFHSQQTFVHFLQALHGLHLKAAGPGVAGLDEELVLVKEFELQPLVLLEVLGEEKAKARIPKSCVLQSRHGKETLP